MTEKEFKDLKIKVLRSLGFINRELLKKKNLYTIIERSGITLDEIRLIGYEYKEESNQMGRVKKIEYEDLPDHLKEQKQEIEEVNNFIHVFNNMNEVHLKQLQDMINNYPIIMEMVNRFKSNQKNILKDEIIIELPFDNDKQISKSFRINGVIAKEWEQFCQDYKEFTVKDLVSMALKEYMSKYR